MKLQSSSSSSISAMIVSDGHQLNLTDCYSYTIYIGCDEKIRHPIVVLLTCLVKVKHDNVRREKTLPYILKQTFNKIKTINNKFPLQNQDVVCVDLFLIPYISLKALSRSLKALSRSLKALSRSPRTVEIHHYHQLDTPPGYHGNHIPPHSHTLL